MIDPAKTKIIYVEDDQDTINLVSLIFNKHGYDLIGVSESQKGLELIESEKPDLVLLDLMLPELDGWHVFRKMKKNPKTMHIPVIIITAKAQPIDKVLGLQIAKVDDYICKPFTPEEILASVQKILQK